MKILILSVIVFSYSMVFASSNRKEISTAHNFNIIFSQDKAIYQENDIGSFEVKIVGINSSKNYFENLNKYNRNKHKNNVSYETVQDYFAERGYHLNLSFPDKLNILDEKNVEFKSSSKNELILKIKTDKLLNNSTNQFYAYLAKDKDKCNRMQSLIKLKMKIQTRINKLENILDKYNKLKYEEIVLKRISKLLSDLSSINMRITSLENNDENILVDNQTFVAVKEVVSRNGRTNSTVNGFKLVLETNPDAQFDNVGRSATAKIINVFNKENVGDDESNDDDAYKYRYIVLKVNGQVKKTSQLLSLGLGQSSQIDLTDLKLTNRTNYIELSLYKLKNQKDYKLIGTIGRNFVSIDDLVSPIWTTNSNLNIYSKGNISVNEQLKDPFGFIDVNLINLQLLQDNNVQVINSQLSIVPIDAGREVLITGQLSNLNDGNYTIQFSAQDFSGNLATPNPYKLNYIVDTIAPVISTALANGYLTNQSSVEVDLNILEVNAIKYIKVFVNSELILTTTDKTSRLTIPLNIEGENQVRIESEDLAGNIAVPYYRKINKDTLPPIITILNPVDNQIIKKMQFKINGFSSEQLSTATVNSKSMLVSSDTTKFDINYIANEEGNLGLTYFFSDLAGNTAIISKNYEIKSKLLNLELISIELSSNKTQLLINGLSGATAPNIDIKISYGFLNLFSETTRSNQDGSFQIKVDYFLNADIKATDPVTNLSENGVLSFNPSNTRLSGVIKDYLGTPLSNVRVYVSNANSSVYTNIDGVFVINNPPSGDQDLIIDASTSPNPTEGPNRKFSKTQVAINVGLGQTNVIDRPIYLVPTYFDGTQKIIPTNEHVVVTNINAPGVILDVPAGSVQFPEGQTERAISILKISSDKSTILPPAGVMPDSVYSFEPSGLSFSQRVQLVLPNENELPPGVELLIYSMNSKTGAWEIDGSAVVDQTGQHVVTKPGLGISHFSLVYAAPLAPIISEAKSSMSLGSASNDKGYKSSINLPSFKSLGTSISPSLIYDSNWANPTVVSSNILDIPEMKTEVEGVFKNSSFEIKNIKTSSCEQDEFTGQIKCVPLEVNQRRDFVTTFEGTAKSWYEPESISAQFFVGNYRNENPITFVPKEASGDQLPGYTYQDNVKSEVQNFIGTSLPRKSVISFGLELYKDNQNYLESGMYPALARYQIKLKHLTLLTGVSRIDFNVSGYGSGAIRQVIDNVQNSKVMDQAIPKDVPSQILINSKVDSSVGRGWDIAGVQKIINPESNKLVIQNENGATEAYALSQTIDNLYNTQNQFSIDKGIDLSNWPKAFFHRTVNNNEVISQINLSTSIITDVNVISNFIDAGSNQGVISNSGLDQCVDFGQSYPGGLVRNHGYSLTQTFGTKYRPEKFRYKIKPNISSLLVLPDMSYFAINTNESEFLKSQNNQTTRLLGARRSIQSHIIATTGGINYRLNLNKNQMKSFCEQTFMQDCEYIGYDTVKEKFCSPEMNIGNPRNFGKWQYCPKFFSGGDGSDDDNYWLQKYFYSDLVATNASSECLLRGNISANHPAYMPSIHEEFSGQVGFSGGPTSNSQDASNPVNVALSSPKDLVQDSEGNFIIADYGNNVVRKYSYLQKNIQTIAGSGGTGADLDDYGVLKNYNEIKIEHPKALAYDGLGNLYIATELGQIFKLTIQGKVVRIAGLPIQAGGILTDSAHASVMAFNNIRGLLFDDDNNLLYVSDSGNNRIVKIDMHTLQVSNIAGSGLCDTSGLANNSVAAFVSICAPTKLGFDDNRNLIFVDSGHGLIRRINLNTGGTNLVYLPAKNDSSKLVKNNDNTWTRTYRSGQIVQFNSAGLQTQSKDRLDRLINYSYENNKLSEVHFVSTNQKIRYTYSSEKLSQIIDPVGRITSFSYTGNLLTSVNFPDGTQKLFNYNSKGMMISETDERGNIRQYEYNAYNQLQKVQESNGDVLETEDVAIRTKGQVSIPVAPKTIGFEPTEVANRVVDAKGIETKFIYDTLGSLNEISDSDGKITRISNNVHSLPIKIEFPDETVVEMIYDEITKDLVKTKFYSKLLPNKIIQTSKTYNAFGQVLSETDIDGKITSYIYSLNGLLMQKSFPNGKAVFYTYFPNGMLESVKTSINNTSNTIENFEYDSYGNLSKNTDNGGNYTEFLNDSAGNIILKSLRQSTQSTQTTNFSYDENNRLTQVKTPKNETTKYRYLPTGQLWKIIDTENIETIFEYDSKGRLIKKINSDGHASQFEYDKNNNLVQSIDPNQNIKTYEYNNENKLIKAVFPDDIIEYTYDIRKKIQSVKNKNSNVYYQRNSIGKIVSISINGSGELSDYPGQTETFVYDDNNRIIEHNSLFGSSKYNYNADNNISKISNSRGENFEFSYDDLDRMIQLKRPGSNTLFSYNASGLLERISNRDNSENSIYFTEYAYNLKNIPVQKAIQNKITNYSFDDNSQLVKVFENNILTEDYSYDSIGNRNSDILGAYTYNSSKQKLLENYQYIFIYDNNGNLIRKNPKNQSNKAFIYQYNSSNSLTKIEILPSVFSTSPDVTIEFFYDVLGRRIQKKSIKHNLQTSTVRKYIYSGENIISELNQQNEVLVNYTHSVFAPDDILSFEVTTTGVQSGIAQNAQKYYPVKDNIGSISAVANESGQIIQKYEYSSFGEIKKISDRQDLDITNSPLVTSQFTYAGREFDIEVGLYYYRARFYDPSIGRFLQVDPDAGIMTDPVTVVNKYTYVMNNPIMYSDPSGEFVFLAPIIAGFAGAYFGSVVAGSIVSYYVLTGFAAIAVGTVVGAASGAAVGAFVGAGVGGVENVVTGGSFGDGAQQGGMAGLYSGALGGAVAGGIQGYYSGLNNSLRFSPDGKYGPAPKGFEWRGGEKGSFYNKQTSEVLRPDLYHKPPIGPHWDYKDSVGNWWRIMPDGNMVPKSGGPPVNAPLKP